MTSLRSLARAAAPSAAVRYAEYAERFKKLGLPQAWCFENQRKHDLQSSKVELLPPVVRRDPGVVLDVGANNGSWALSILRTLPVKRLLAFEPQPDVCAATAMRLAAFPGAQCFPVALGEHEATLSLRIEGTNDLASFLPLRDEVKPTYHAEGHALREVNVPVRRLDDYTRDIDRIGIFKLDVQGFESQVVAGGERTLAKTDCMIIEVNYESHYEGDTTFDGTHRLLADRGFRVYAISAPWFSEDGHPMWADAVYVRNGLATR
jgi:FkbM family methyltransferase